MKLQMKIEGIEELRENMRKFQTSMVEELEAGTQAAAQVMAGVVRGNAPVGPTRNLVDAVETKPLPKKHGYPSVTMVGLNYNRAPHQHLVEFGSGPRAHASGKSVGQMPASGFFRKSIDESASMVKGIISEAASKAVRKGGS